ncbi:OLC1v1022691C1 [Oldenlandia corymbosa var. corymbosa]|uniref:OLC1v1022691C1 n=1 Tax=Oldenlandia corymbosa var. corymbosa TaxID=529605 RepID=A0AAV1C237_OLDCO|nr:OLC1v1022691C1 [Oldenlandia corymbosa var. corymbosa]
MKKGIHPQQQWMSYVTQSGRLINIMMTKIHQVGKVYHIRSRKQMAQTVGQIAKYKRRYEQQQTEQATEQATESK